MCQFWQFSRYVFTIFLGNDKLMIYFISFKVGLSFSMLADSTSRPQQNLAPHVKICKNCISVEQAHLLSDYSICQAKTWDRFNSCRRPFWPTYSCSLAAYQNLFPVIAPPTSRERTKTPFNNIINLFRYVWLIPTNNLKSPNNVAHSERLADVPKRAFIYFYNKATLIFWNPTGWRRKKATNTEERCDSREERPLVGYANVHSMTVHWLLHVYNNYPLTMREFKIRHDC